MKVVPGGVRTGSVGGGGSLRKRSEGRVGRVLWQDCLPALFAPGKLPCLTGVIFALPRFDREGGFTLPCATAHGTGQCPTSKRGAKCNGLSSPIPVPIDWNSTNSSPRSAHRSLSRTRAPGVVGGIGSRRCAFGRARPRSGSAGTKGVLITRLLSLKKRYQRRASARSFSRLWSPSCRPSARGRRGGPVARINVLPGRHVGVVPVARRSSRLVPLPWVAAQPRALVQLVHLLHALGGGPSSHALAKHGRPAPPRRARPTRRVPLRSQAVRLSLHWCVDEGLGTLPGSGKARCARCARRDRPGAPWGRATPLRT